MKRILIINATKTFAHSLGELNKHLSNFACELLKKEGHEVQMTNVDEGYNIESEIEKYLWADSIIYQMPAWWMGEPWIMKKYIDEVFTGGHGKLYASDGRSSSEPSKNYGSGGLIQGKNYMLSVTWNAPKNAFVDKEDFFQGAGVDGVYLPFHKANQFLGMKPLPTFMCNDVMKDPKIASDLERYKTHLLNLFEK